MTFNVVITTIGRDTLQRMIDSIAHQLTSDDYLTIIWDAGSPSSVTVNTAATVFHIINSKPLGSWGHGSRTRWQNSLPGDFMINGDDDDMFTADAMTVIREHCLDNKLYVFEMEFEGGYRIPDHHKIEFGNIGTPCGVYMHGELPEWGMEYGGDHVFYRELEKKIPVVFVDKLIYKVKP